MILTPNGHVPGSWPSGIAYSYGPNGTYLCEQDPQHHERGEYGLYPDTMLGAPARKPSLAQRIKRSLGLGSGGIPTDADLSSIYGYTPYNNGWVAFQNGNYPGSWTSPNGYQPGIPMQHNPAPLAGLRDAATIPPQATPNDMIMALNEHNQRMFTLAVVSTVVAGVAAMVTLYRATKGLRED